MLLFNNGCEEHSFVFDCVSYHVSRFSRQRGGFFTKKF